MSDKDEPVLIYSTYPTRDAAQVAAHQLVSRKFAACANILPQMTSVFAWNGEISSEEEVVMILKTISSRAAGAAELIEQLHPYETPAVLIIPVCGGSAPFIDWLVHQTQAHDETD